MSSSSTTTTNSTMWNPYQSLSKQPSSSQIYTSTSTSPLDSTTSSDSSSSPNTSSSEKSSSRIQHQQTPLSVSSFIPTPDYEQDDQVQQHLQQNREQSPANYLAQSNQTFSTNNQNTCRSASSDSENSDVSSLDPSTPSYRSPSNSFTNYNYNSAYQINNFTQAQPNYSYFNDFQNNYYGATAQLKSEYNYYAINNNNNNSNHLTDSSSSTTANVSIKSEDKKSTPTPPPSSSTPPSLPLANINNTSQAFTPIHAHNPYAAFNSYYNGMNLNPYYHHHQHYFPHSQHHSSHFNPQTNPIHFNNTYLNRTEQTSPKSSNLFANQQALTNKIKNESFIPRPQITVPIPTISDSNISCSYDYDPNGIAAVMTDFDLREYKDTNPNIKASLQDKTLWKEFQNIGTEMIITKCGRRMFPSLRVSVSGLDPNTKYVMLVNVEPVDDNRYKYHNCEWIVSGKAEAHFRGRAYRHPDSPLSGNQWMKQIISFHKLKLTNNPFDRSGHLVLNSMHKYAPVLHILSQGNVKTYNRICFNEAIFTAVTAYQNEAITKLKIEYNPFAKGFRDGHNRKDYRAKRNSDDENDPIEDNVQSNNSLHQQSYCFSQHPVVNHNHQQQHIPMQLNNSKSMKYDIQDAYDQIKQLSYVR